MNSFDFLYVVTDFKNKLLQFLADYKITYCFQHSKVVVINHHLNYLAMYLNDNYNKIITVILVIK